MARRRGRRQEEAVMIKRPISTTTQKCAAGVVAGRSLRGLLDRDTHGTRIWNLTAFGGRWAAVLIGLAWVWLVAPARPVFAYSEPGYFFSTDPTDNNGYPPGPSYPRSQWMTDSLCPDLRLSEITIPGTHDSGTFAYLSNLNPHHFQPEVCNLGFDAGSLGHVDLFGCGPGAYPYNSEVQKTAATQSMDYLHQLAAGIRFLDIRLGQIRGTDCDITNPPENLWVVHADHVCYPWTIDDVMPQVRDFLRDAPKETVLIQIQNDTNTDENHNLPSDYDFDRILRQHLVAGGWADLLYRFTCQGGQGIKEPENINLKILCQTGTQSAISSISRCSNDQTKVCNSNADCAAPGTCGSTLLTGPQDTENPQFQDIQGKIILLQNWTVDPTKRPPPCTDANDASWPMCGDFIGIPSPNLLDLGQIDAGGSDFRNTPYTTGLGKKWNVEIRPHLEKAASFTPPPYPLTLAEQLNKTYRTGMEATGGALAGLTFLFPSFPPWPDPFFFAGGKEDIDTNSSQAPTPWALGPSCDHEDNCLNAFYHDLDSVPWVFYKGINQLALEQINDNFWTRVGIVAADFPGPGDPSSPNDADHYYEHEGLIGVLINVNRYFAKYVTKKSCVPLPNPDDSQCKNAPPNATCDDGDPCTINDFCLDGICNFGNPACNIPLGDHCHQSRCDATNQAGVLGFECSLTPTCTALDQCHIAVCDPTNGNCSSPPAPDGTPCNDGLGCTINDQCIAGVCSGTRMICPGRDQCHSNQCEEYSQAPGYFCCSMGFANCPGDVQSVDGTACDDGNDCTANDQCLSGTCAGMPATCATSTPIAPTATPAVTPPTNPQFLCPLSAPNLGQLSSTAIGAGIACYYEQGNCFFTDAGALINLDNRNCPANAALNQCFNTSDGTSCDDGNPSTSNDQCIAGICSGTLNTPTIAATATATPTPNQCLDAPPDAVCDDGDPCTTNDVCLAGACHGDPVFCTAQDQCHLAGTCDPSSGICSNPAAPDGTACDDGDTCTSNDQCTAGTCAGTGACTATATPITLVTPTTTSAAAATSTATAAATGSPAATETPCPERTGTGGPSCAGDCNGDGSVRVNELIIGVNIALGNASVCDCPSFDSDFNRTVSINELIAAVLAALNGCPS
jgi:hypothetical protein